MKYTLITPKGRVMTFFIRQVAELYQTINGGTLIDQETSKKLQDEALERLKEQLEKPELMGVFVRMKNR